MTMKPDDSETNLEMFTRGLDQVIQSTKMFNHLPTREQRIQRSFDALRHTKFNVVETMAMLAIAIDRLLEDARQSDHYRNRKQVELNLVAGQNAIILPSAPDPATITATLNYMLLTPSDYEIDGTTMRFKWNAAHQDKLHVGYLPQEKP